MKLCIIGSGYVGLVSGACFSEFGFQVVCVDKDQNKIDQLKQGIIPIYEPGLDTMVKENAQFGRLHFTTSLKEGMEAADIVFIAVGTPHRRGDGQADLTYVFEAVNELAEYIKKYTLIVTKSTVPVGTGQKIFEQLSQKVNPQLFSVASNPEFLREGSAIEDFMRPNRVVVGVRDNQAESYLREIYRPLFLRETPMVVTSIETAELIKYASNAFLATKITFINEMADLCEKVGANIQDVAKGMGLDNRIGSKFLHAGPGYGGSCFPKDTKALIYTAKEKGAPTQIVETVARINDERKIKMAEKIITLCGGTVKGKTLAILGLAFKPNTDDMRDSPSLDIIPILSEHGAILRVFDPKSMDEAKKLLPQNNITWCQDTFDCLKEAEAIVILTEWNVFRALNLNQVKDIIKTPLIIDLRNIYAPEDVANLGFIYHSIGRQSTYPEPMVKHAIK